MTTCLLTGVGGSIGIHMLCHIFRTTDWDVVGIDSFRHMGWSDRITEAMSHHPEWHSQLKVVTHDLTTPISPVLALRIGANIDYIINMASLSDVEKSIEDPYRFIVGNTQLILTMLEYCRWLSVKPKAFLHVSTDEVYGPTYGHITHKEWNPILPSSPYAASKACQEAIAISYWRTFGVPLILVNVMNNFGEMQNPNKFPAIIQRKVATGQPIKVHGSPDNTGTRYYMHSSNTADAILFLLKNHAPYFHEGGKCDKPDRYNIVGDKQINNVELVTTIAKMMSKPVEIRFEAFDKTRPGHDRHYGLNGAKMAKLGWKAPVSFEDSLREVVKWQSEHPEWIKCE